MTASVVDSSDTTSNWTGLLVHLSFQKVEQKFQHNESAITMEKFHFKGLMCPTLTAFTEDKYVDSEPLNIFFFLNYNSS